VRVSMPLIRLSTHAANVCLRLPRLHFIPLSSSYEEIYNIYAFFSGPTPTILKAANITASAREDKGVTNDELLRKISRAGKRWKRTIGRPIDMEGECSFAKSI
jgi:hypothetical protein